MKSESESWIVSVSLDTGSFDLLAPLQGTGIYLGGSAIDSKRHRYYYTQAMSRQKIITEFDVRSRKFTNRTWTFDYLIQSMQYDSKRDQLIGVNSTTAVVALQLESGKVVQLVQTSQAGIPNLYDSVYDEDLDLYVYGTTKFSEYNRVLVNVVNKQFKIIPHFTRCKHTHLIPRIH